MSVPTTDQEQTSSVDMSQLYSHLYSSYKTGELNIESDPRKLQILLDYQLKQLQNLSAAHPSVFSSSNNSNSGNGASSTTRPNSSTHPRHNTRTGNRNRNQTASGFVSSTNDPRYESLKESVDTLKESVLSAHYILKSLIELHCSTKRDLIVLTRENGRPINSNQRGNTNDAYMYFNDFR